MQQALKQLCLCYKLQMLAAAASSGSVVNLELAWGLLQPCLFPTMEPCLTKSGGDAGTAAIQSGHAHLLPWLVQHGCPLDPEGALVAAAAHLDPAGLRAIGELLGTLLDLRLPRALLCRLTTAAGRSADPASKVQWLLLGTGVEGEPHERQQVLAAAVVGAAESGSLPKLQSLCDIGLDLSRAVPCRSSRGRWREPASTCACGKAQRRGVPMQEKAMQSAASAGRLEAVQSLHQGCALALTAHVFKEAAGSGSVATVEWMLQAGCPVGRAPSEFAVSAGDVGMVPWLVEHVDITWGLGEPVCCRRMCCYPPYKTGVPRRRAAAAWSRWYGCWWVRAALVVAPRGVWTALPSWATCRCCASVPARGVWGGVWVRDAGDGGPGRLRGGCGVAGGGGVCARGKLVVQPVRDGSWHR